MITDTEKKSRAEVIACLERSEHPYRGWMDDYPDLRDEYYERLSPWQQGMVNWFNSMSDSDWQRYKSMPVRI